MRIKPALLLYSAIVLAPLAAVAEPAAEVPRPTDPAARVPGTAYESAFSGYRPDREEKLAPWREINDAVGRAGGHIGIMRTEAHATGDGAPPNVGNPSAGQASPVPINEAAGAPTTRSAPRMPHHSGH